ncbi:Polymorphic membrane protein 20 [Limihaloglobus sulfuriphilus]|uniref:Polymorphic membrane protein 20 n=2 Tax=Limihaloglobus sulfuriphilus TaxID=1851148 RepID=A0A1Q2MIE3_9BACT|nr:Polymorphic membrane protein 20 [Limihaloglobus sulfuriphilus]
MKIKEICRNVKTKRPRPLIISAFCLTISSLCYAVSLDDLVVSSGGKLTGNHPNYTLHENVFVGDYLYIAPGTTILCDTSAGKRPTLVIDEGKIFADGEPDSPITFTAPDNDLTDDDATPDYWRLLEIHDTSEPNSVMEHCIFEKAKIGLYTKSPNLQVTDSLFRNCKRGVAVYDGQATFTGCEFYNNSYPDNSGAGLDADGSGVELTIDSCHFHNNQSKYGGGISVENVASSSIVGCIIENNLAEYGGGLEVDDAPMTISQSTVINNEAEYGGGIISHGTSACTITDCTLESNSAAISGGAVYSDSTLNISASIFSTNTALSGGAILNDTGNIIVSDSEFEYNIATQSEDIGGGGGAICSLSGVHITYSTFVGNESIWGGAVEVTAGQSTIAWCEFDNNVADWGGAVYCNEQNGEADLYLHSSLLSNNNAKAGGSAIYGHSGSLTLRQNTISRNFSQYEYAAVEAVSATIRMDNSIVADNSPADVGGAFDPASTNNLIGTIEGASGFDSPANLIGTESSPIDPRFINAEDGVFRLLLDSPAIDAALNSCAVDKNGSSLLSDLGERGRVIDAVVDIGAYECQKADVPSVVVTTSSDSDPDDGKISLREAIYYSKINQGVSGFNTISILGFHSPDFALYITLGPLVITHDVTIHGGVVYRPITINGNDNSNVISILGSDTNVCLRYMDITGGKGCIYNEGNLTLEGVKIHNNSGDGIYSSGSLTLNSYKYYGRYKQFDISDNTGDGIYIENAELKASNGYIGRNAVLARNSRSEITNVNVEGQDASLSFLGSDALLSDINLQNAGPKSPGFWEGAMTVSEGVVSITNSNIIDSSCLGVLAGYGGSISISGCTISGNQWSGIMPFERGNGANINVSHSVISDNGHHGIWSRNNEDTIMVTNSQINCNDWSGITTVGDVKISNVLMIGNGQRDYPYGSWQGGVRNEGGNIEINNCTISDSIGFGVRGESGSTVLNNTIVSMTDSSDGSDGDDISYSGGTLSGSNNLIGDGSGQGGLVNGINGNIIGTSQFPINPNFRRRISFGSDGVWGEGFDDLGDYRLADVSPAINAGNNTFAVNPDGSALSEDLSGSNRIVNSTVDIGAYEYVLEEMVYEVNSNLDEIAIDGNVTFREALTAANTNSPCGDASAGNAFFTDRIILSEDFDDIISLSGAPLEIFDSVNIVGRGQDISTIDAQGNSRAIHIYNQAEVNLSGLNIINGQADFGGGILIESGSLNLTDSFVASNNAISGGGNYAEVGTVSISDCNFSSNYADLGGGIYMAAGSLQLNNSSITGHSGESGAGVFVESGTAQLTDCDISHNSASYSGGGLYAQSGEITLRKTDFLRNSAESGGGVYSEAGTIVTHNSFIQGNTSTFGGGLCAEGGSAFYYNTVFAGNESVDSGGAIYVNTSQVDLFNVSVAGNSAGTDGGGVFINTDGSVALYNSIFADNNAPGGKNIYDLSNNITGEHNILSDGSGQSALTNGVNGNLVGTATAPIDPLFMAIPYSGVDGIWGTDDDDYGNLRLEQGTPAFEAGSGAYVFDNQGNPLVADAYGNPRIMGDTVDIGAFEYPLETPSTVVNTLADIVDSEDGHVSLREALIYQKALGTEITFLPGLSGTIVLNGTHLVIDSSVTITGPDPDLLTISGNQESRIFTITGTAVTITNLTISNGYSDNGGGVACENARLMMKNCIIRECFGDYRDVKGTGISAVNSIVNLTDCCITKNGSRHNMYGTLYCGEGTRLEVNRCLIVQNVAAYGAGLFVESNCDHVEVNNCLIIGNCATSGAGMFTMAGTLVINNSSISRNKSVNGGGGLSGFMGSTYIVNNSIIAKNESDDDAYIDVSFKEEDTVEVNASLVGVGIEGLIDGVSNITGTLSQPADPLFIRNPSAGPDGVWGTEDDDLGDLRLQSNSPARDAGSNALAIDSEGNPLEFDLDGKTRIVGTAVDMGAYEFITGDFVGNDGVNLRDFAVLANAWQSTVEDINFNEQCDLHEDGVVDIFDLALFAEYWLEEK